MAVGRAEILVVADASEFDRQMRRVLNSARTSFGGIKRDAESSNQSVAKMGKSLGGLVGILGRVAAGGLGIGAIAGGLGAAAASAVQFAAALAPAVGLVAAAPAAIGLLAGAVAVLTVAVSGVGDAFAAAVSGDAAEFNEALEGLAPSAQAAAIALRDITPQFTALRESVQGAFFEGFDTTLRTIAATLVGPLTEGMTAAAAGLAGITTRIGEAVTSGAGIAFIQTTFAALANVLANLQEPLGLLVGAFLSLGSSINIAFGGAEAGAALGALIEQFAAFINTAADSGAAVGWVEGAIVVFSQLGAIVGSVVGIIGTIGQVAADTGGNILGAFGAALESVNAFLSSAEGIATLTSIFTTLNAVGQVFGTVLSGLLPIIAPLVGVLVSGLMPVLESLTPLLLQIAAAAAPIFTQILAAVLPLIPPLVQIAQQILPLVASLFSALVAAVAPLLEVLVTLLVTVLEPLIPALMPLIELVGTLAGLLASALVPIFELLGDILLWVVNEIIVPFVIPIIELLVEWLGTTLVDAVNVLGLVFQTVIDAIVAAATWLGDRWKENVALMQLGWQLLQDKLRAGYNFIKSNVIDPVRNAFSSLSDKAVELFLKMSSKWTAFVDKMKAGVDNVKDFIGDLFSPLWNGFRSAVNSIINGWNGLSFTMPSVDLGPLGSTPSFTVSTPNIPTLQTSGFSFGEGLVNLHPNEAIVNAKDRRGLNMLADALEMAGAGGGGIVVERGAIVIEFHGATPDPAQARRIGEAAGDGLMRTLATRGAQQAVRRF
jgi:phage-related protein